MAHTEGGPHLMPLVELMGLGYSVEFAGSELIQHEGSCVLISPWSAHLLSL